MQCTKWKYAAALVASLIGLPSNARAQSTQASGEESLGDKLLEDLNPISEASTSAASSQHETESVTRDNQPATGTAAGDVTAPVASPMIPFARVRQSMQNAQFVLIQPVSGTRTGTIALANSVQRQIISDLDQLIASLSKQCQCQGGQGDTPPPQDASKSKPGSPSGLSASQSQAPARDSSNRLERTSSQQVDKGRVNDAVKKLWGHLPERSREQMLQSFSDEFLPQYELEIEQYYRRLSEEQGTASQPQSPGAGP